MRAGCQVQAVLRSKEAHARDVIQTMLASQKEVFTLNDYYMQTNNKMKEDVQALKQWKNDGCDDDDEPSLSPDTAGIASPVSRYLSHAMPCQWQSLCWRLMGG